MKWSSVQAINEEGKLKIGIGWKLMNVVRLKDSKKMKDSPIIGQEI